MTVRPESEGEPEKREVPDGLWTKCEQCRAVLYSKDLERNLQVCDKCGYHFPIGARDRLAQLLDDVETFEEFDGDLAPGNPLEFPQYPEKIARSRKRSGNRDAVVTGIGRIGGVDAVVAVMDFAFMGGSMGSVVGERITRAFERAASRLVPIVTVSASGGARMQEGILSLMQMQKTCAAAERFGQQGLFFVSVLTNPTTAGVFGSFASLGDVNLAEPDSTIGFAGQRVIEETIRKKIPPNLQKAETVYANGFVDRVVPRKELKGEIAKLLLWHTAEGPIRPGADADDDDDTARVSANGKAAEVSAKISEDESGEPTEANGEAAAFNRTSSTRSEQGSTGNDS